MKECVRSRNNVEQFDVKKGLSPLFNIFIASVQPIVVERFSEDADILPELVRLQEQPRKTRPKSLIACICRVVWDML